MRDSVDVPSLPRYPSPQQPPAADAPARRGWRVTPRQTRLLIDLAWLAGIVVLFVWLRQAADSTRHPPQPAVPLDFTLVRERFANVRLGMSSEEVFDLLGPPGPSALVREPEFDGIEAVLEAHPDRYPAERRGRYWLKWANPKDEGTWAAVLITGGHVAHLEKKGF